MLVRLLSQIEGCNLSRDLHVVELFSHVSVQSVAFAIDNVSEIHWFVKKSWLKQCTNNILIISNSIEKISGTSCLKINQGLDWIFHRDQTMRSVFMRRLLIISVVLINHHITMFFLNVIRRRGRVTTYLASTQLSVSC